MKRTSVFRIPLNSANLFSCFSTLNALAPCLRFTLGGVVAVTTSGLGVSAEACDPETKLKLGTNFPKNAETVGIFNRKGWNVQRCQLKMRPVLLLPNKHGEASLYFRRKGIQTRPFVFGQNEHISRIFRTTKGCLLELENDASHSKVISSGFDI